MNISKFLRANGLSFLALLATAMAHAGAAIALAAGVHGIFDRLAGNGAAAAAPLLHPALPAIAAIAVLFVLPWLDRSPVKSMRYKGWLSKIWLWVFCISFVILGVLGVLAPNPGRTLLSQVCTFLYFAYFILMPFYTRLEKTKPVPERVTG